MIGTTPVRALGVVLWVVSRVWLQRLELLVRRLLRVLVAVVGHVPPVGCRAWSASAWTFLVVAVEVLDVERAPSLVVAEGTSWPRLQSLVLRSSPALSVEMLTQISVGRFQRVHYLWSPTSTLEGDLAMGLVEMVDVVLLLALEVLLPPVRIFEYLRKDSLAAWVCLATLKADASTMDAVELVLDASRGPRGSLAASGPGVATTLSHGGPRNLKLRCWARNQILGLVAAWLKHEALVIHSALVLNRARIYRLPSVLCSP